MDCKGKSASVVLVAVAAATVGKGLVQTGVEGATSLVNKTAACSGFI